MGKYVDKIIHDKALGGCGGHTLGVFLQPDGTHDGFCFSCNKKVLDPYANMPDGYTAPKPKIKSPEEIKKEIDSIRDHPSLDLPDRKLGKRTLEYFGVKVGLDEQRATEITSHYYPYYETGSEDIASYKVRIVEGKKFFKIGKTRGLEPFGWRQAMKSNHTKLFIAEGEIDAMSLFKIITMHSTMGGAPAVISLPDGSSSVNMLSTYLNKMRNKFKEIILVPDNDDAGAEAVNTFCKLIPEIKIAELPLKDPNEMLKQGRDKEAFDIIMWRSKTRLSGKMVSSGDLWDKARERPAMGVSWPWQGLTEKTRGVRTGEGYYFGGGVKMGKSSIVNALATHFILEHGERVFLCKPEEAPVVTARKLAGYAVGHIFDDPNIEFDEDAYSQGAGLIADSAILYDNYQKTEWADVKEAIRHAVVAQGCKRVILDPITCFTIGISASERNEVLIEIASEIASLAKELDFTYFVFCHLNTPSSGLPHERGGEVQSLQFAGSRGMMRSCHYMIGIEGNKDPDLPLEQRNMRDLVILEDRNFGESGKINLFYNRKTGVLNEISNEQRQFMEED